MPKSIQSLYGNRVRVRVSGIWVIENSLLMVNHAGLGDGDFWAPPGGGIELNESAQDALAREFMEETNLQITIQELLFVAEFISAPLHAIELFFRIDSVKGQLIKGNDPEMDSENQIIKGAQFFSFEEIKNMEPNQVHGIFKYTPDPAKILDLRGYFKL